MKRRSFNPGTLTAPIPPAMVTVGTMEKPNVLTVAWTGILATHPAKTYVSVRPSRHSYGILREGGEFVINLPSASLARAVDYVGIYTGAKVDKFKKCGLTSVKSEKVAPPTIAECPVALECVVTDVMPMGTHDVFIADIVSVSCREELLDSEGKLHFERGDLLAYVHGEYYTLGERVGRFGFSTDKADGKADAPRRGKAAPSKTIKEKDGTEGAAVEHKGERKASSVERSAKGGRRAPADEMTRGGKSASDSIDTERAAEPVMPDWKARPFYLDAPRKRPAAKTRADKDKGKRKNNRRKI